LRDNLDETLKDFQTCTTSSKMDGLVGYDLAL